MPPEEIIPSTESEKLHKLVELFTIIQFTQYGKVEGWHLDQYEKIKASYISGHENLERLYPDPDLRSSKFDAFVMGCASKKLLMVNAGCLEKKQVFTKGWGGSGDYPLEGI